MRNLDSEVRFLGRSLTRFNQGSWAKNKKNCGDGGRDTAFDGVVSSVGRAPECGSGGHQFEPVTTPILPEEK